MAGFGEAFINGFSKGMAVGQAWSEKQGKRELAKASADLQQINSAVQSGSLLYDDPAVVERHGEAMSRWFSAAQTAGVSGKDFEKYYPPLMESGFIAKQNAIRRTLTAAPGSPEALDALKTIAVIDTGNPDVPVGYDQESGAYYYVPIEDGQNPDEAKAQAVVVTQEQLMEAGAILEDPENGVQDVMSHSRAVREANERIAQQEEEEYGRNRRHDETQGRLAENDRYGRERDQVADERAGRQDARLDAAEQRAQRAAQWDEVEQQEKARGRGGVPKDVSERLADPTTIFMLDETAPELVEAVGGDAKKLPRLIRQQAAALNAQGLPASFDDAVEALIASGGVVSQPSTGQRGALPLGQPAYGDQSDTSGPRPGMAPSTAAPQGAAPAPQQSQPQGALPLSQPAPAAGGSPPQQGTAPPSNVPPELGLLMGAVQSGKLSEQELTFRLQKQKELMPGATDQDAMVALAQGYARRQQRQGAPQ